jgi:hypothetical protein
LNVGRARWSSSCTGGPSGTPLARTASHTRRTKMSAMMMGGTRTGRPLTLGLGVVGKLAVGWAVGGGVLVGGVLVAGMTLAGQLSGFGLLLTATGLFAIGAALGFVHGGLLGWMSRPPEMTRREALGSLGMGAVYAVPALLVSWLVAGWIAMTTVALYSGKVAGLVGCGIAWLVGAGVLVLAAEQGWTAVRRVYAGWSNARVATLLVAAVYGGLLAVFVAERPQLWGLPVQVTPVGAVLLATAVTLWLAGPMVALSLSLLDRLPSTRPAVAFGGRGRALASIGIAVGVGIVLALMALPFYTTAYGVTTGGLTGVLSGALVDEALFRLFIVTAVAWVGLREFGFTESKAVGVAIAVAALAQVLIYLPGVLAIGFPSATTMLGFLAVTAAVPALAFGVLFWRRGFGTALVAHATALAALFLIAGA